MRETDEELYMKASAQNEDALESLYDRYEKLVFSFAYRMTKNRALAEEVVQDVFMKIWSQKQTFDPAKGKFSSWILTVTRNASIDYIRKQKETPYELDERDSLHEQTAPTEDQVEWMEQKEVIQQAIKQLTKEQQEVIELFYFKGMPHSQIAEKCDIPLGTVKGRVRLALKHLHGMFSPVQTKEGQKDV